MKKEDKLIKWLLEGDISIQYQVYRDLLELDKVELQKRIESEGWGENYISRQKPDGHWGNKFYHPKWTSTHYTLLDLRNLNIRKNHEAVGKTIAMVLENNKATDGGILPIGMEGLSDVCVNGMFLNYASYFLADEDKLRSVVDCILSQRMTDGGFNCRLNRSGAKHSSLHSTLSVIEGITTYKKNDYTYRISELEDAQLTSIEFILLHQLYISDRTGEVINKDFLRFSYPGRWRYDVLRALDYLQYSQTQWDPRMQAAIDVLLSKRNKEGSWNLNAKHAGQFHFEMEKAGKASRWNTLRALRVLKHFEIKL